MGYTDYLQRRVIARMARRNMQGWGRPIEFSWQRLKLGGIFSGAGMTLGLIDIALFGLHSLLSKGSLLALFLDIASLLAFFIGIGLLWNTVPVIWKARNQPVQTVQGIVDAAICSMKDYVPYASVEYHFITVKNGDGQLRAYAIDPSLHKKLCQVGKKVSFHVEQGTEHVSE